MEKFELYKILTIETEEGNDKDYTIANILEYNETTYFYLIEVDKEENLIEKNQMIVRLVSQNGEDAVEKVTNKEELKEVTSLFFDIFRDEIEKDNN